MGCTWIDSGKWLDVSAWFIREWITSLTAYTSESIFRLWEWFPNLLIAPRTNIQTMSKADNNNKYNYDPQALDEKYTR